MRVSTKKLIFTTKRRQERYSLFPERLNTVLLTIFLLSDTESVDPSLSVYVLEILIQTQR